MASDLAETSVVFSLVRRLLRFNSDVRPDCDVALALAAFLPDFQLRIFTTKVMR